MKRNIKVTLCGIAAALSVVLMLLSYFPYLTYGIPIVSGLFTMMLVIETDKKWALGSYAVSAVLVFILAEPKSRLLYICLFGYYPIVKALIERIGKPVAEWALKLLVFNAAALVVYFLFAGLFGISTEDFGALGRYGAYVFLAICNAAFVIYDLAISRMAGVYLNMIHPKIEKYLK